MSYPVPTLDEDGKLNESVLPERLGATELSAALEPKLNTADLSAGVKTSLVPYLPKSIAPPIITSTLAHSFDAETSIYNGESPNFRLFKAEVMESSYARRQLVMMGHSYMAGSNAVPGLSDTGMALRRFLRGHGISAVSAIAPMKNGETRDVRYSTTGTWTAANATSPAAFAESNVVGSTVTFTSDEPATVIDIYTYANSGPFTYSIDGAAAVTVTANGGAVIRTITVGGLANAVHTVTVTVTSTSMVFLVGIGARQSETTGLEIFNFGYGGTVAGNWTSTSTLERRGTATSVASLRTMILLQIDTNNIRQGLPLTSWIGDMQTILTSHTGLGHGILLINSINARNAGPLTDAVWKPWYEAAYALADQFNIALLDTTHLFGGWEAAVAAGMTGDGLHLNRKGWAYTAEGIARAITKV